MQLKNRVAIVTGGASGLGEATVREFVSAGARVLILDVNEQKGAALSRELGAPVLYRTANVADERHVQSAIDEILEKWGGVHICVNCAGIGVAIKTIGKQGPMPLDEFRRIIDVNLVGTFNVLRLAAWAMSRNEPVGGSGERGVIINTASIAAFEGQIGQAGYSASKGGVAGLTVPCARDLATYGIRVMTIAPGLIRTPMFFGLSDDAMASLEKSIVNPKRLGHPAEYASLARHIVENAYLNSETIRLDAGVRLAPR